MWTRVGNRSAGAQKVFGWFGGAGINGTGAYGKGSDDFGLF
jgi:hypothetical protein